MNQPIGDVNTDNGAPDISSLPNSPTIIDASNAPSDFQMSSSDRQLDAIDEDSVPTKPSGHFDTCADDIRSLAVQRPVAKEVPSTTPFHALWFPFKSSFRRPSLFGGKDDDSDGDLPIEPLPVESMHTHHSSIVAMNDRKGIAFEECPLPLPEQLWMVPQFGHNSSSMQNLQFMSNLHLLSDTNVSVENVRSYPQYAGVLPASTQFTSLFLNPIDALDLDGVMASAEQKNMTAGEVPNVLSSFDVNARTAAPAAMSKEPKKNAMLPIKLSRRGPRVSNAPRERHRGSHKKQRAAHQASSPPSQASTSIPGTPLNCGKRDSSPPPKVRTIQGKRVTMIDEALKVFVVDLLTPETCDLVRNMADAHVRQVNETGNRVATWRTLYTYTKQDLPCSEVKNLTERVTSQIMSSVIGIVGEIFGKPREALKLHPRSWKEPHLLLYQHLEGKPLHTGVEMHYDGCDITWNCMLSKSCEYEGGGTYIRALKKTVRLEQGQVLVHPGELYHKGCDITNGVRALIVCFMDGYDPNISDPSSSKEDLAEYEKNVRMY